MQKFQEKIIETRKYSYQISNMLSNENEINSFLSSGHSYNQRDWLSAFYETPVAARGRSEKLSKLVKSGERKTKQHTGKPDNYEFEKEAFQKYIMSLPSGSKVSWRELSIKFNLRNKKGARPQNGGQVLAEFAKTFNPQQRLSGRDIQRVRRAKHKLYKKVSIPTPRLTKHLQSAIRKKLKQKNSTLVKRLPQTLSTEKK